MCADLVVIKGTTGDAYRTLIGAAETDIQLVMINGVARYGDAELLRQTLGKAGASITVGGSRRALYLDQATADPEVRKISYASARKQLRDALLNLPALAKDLAKAESRPKPRTLALLGAEAPVWRLALDELGGTGVELRPRLPVLGTRSASGPRLRTAATAPVQDLVSPISLDPLTVSDDGDYAESLVTREGNLPEEVRAALREIL